MSIRSAPASAAIAAADAHHVGVVAEQLDRDRVLVRVDAQQLASSCARCGGGGRSSRPSPRPRAPRRGAAPAGARTSCRSRPAARAARGWRQLDVADPKGRCERRLGIRRFRSQISRRPVSVSRSSTSSIVSQNGTIAAAWPPVAISCGSSAELALRCGAAIASTRPAKPKTMPDWRLAWVILPITPGSLGGSPSSIGGSFAARSASASIEISTPGPITPPRYSPSAETDVEGDRGAEVDHGAGAAESARRRRPR